MRSFMKSGAWMGMAVLATVLVGVTVAEENPSDGLQKSWNDQPEKQAKNTIPIKNDDFSGGPAHWGNDISTETNDTGTGVPVGPTEYNGETRRGPREDRNGRTDSPGFGCPNDWDGKQGGSFGYWGGKQGGGGGGGYYWGGKQGGGGGYWGKTQNQGSQPTPEQIEMLRLVEEQNALLQEALDWLRVHGLPD